MDKFTKKGLNSGVTYEYACQKCGQEFSERRQVDERDKTSKCFNCGSRNVLRKMGFSGWSMK